VFVVGCLGDWRSAAKVLFESESLCRDITPSRSERKEIAKCITTGIGTRLDGETDTFVTKVYENHPSDSRVKDMGDVCQTVTSSWGTGGGNIPFALKNITYGFEPGITKREGDPSRFSKEISPTLRREMGDNQIAMINKYAVRRLTPIECERLQGFPDNYTNIKENCPDGHRYKALGNSMAVPVMKWIGQRINNI
jgi:DNA (cytosine-5)-methyltransferase 1